MSPICVPRRPAVAVANGYYDALLGITVSVIDSVDDNTAIAHNGQLPVTITHRVDTFFLNIFGLNDVAIARTAWPNTCNRWVKVSTHGDR